MPAREKEGYKYIPKPHDTSKVDIEDLQFLVELLAQNCHEMWARGRLVDGWNWGVSISYIQGNDVFCRNQEMMY
jgi:hypothetical protein